MRNVFLPGLALAAFMVNNSAAQHVNARKVPPAVTAACAAKYATAEKIGWEKENGNFEANWGGSSGEDTAVQFTPAGVFVEIAIAMPVSLLPAPVAEYVKNNYKAAKIKEAAKVTNSAGKLTYEAEVKGKDLVFDEAGNFLRQD